MSGSLLLDRAKVFTSTTGTGTVTLGLAVLPYQTWAAAGAVDQSTYAYLIEDGTAWELGSGKYTSSGTTLTRSFSSSSTGSALNLSGSATVACVARSQDLGQRFEAFGGVPETSAFTGYNMQAGATFTKTGNALVLDLPGGVFNIQAQYMAAPVSTPYDLYARIGLLAGSTTSRGGISFMNNTSKKFTNLQYASTNLITVGHDTGPSTFNATQFQPNLAVFLPWFRLRNDGTNIIAYVSNDGRTWKQIYTETLASFIGSVDNIALMSWSSNSATIYSTLWCTSFGTIAPA